MPRLRDPDTFRRMPDAHPRLYFDFVDPGSFLVLRRMARLGLDFDRLGFELRTPSDPLVDPTDPAWLGYWDEVEPALRDAGVTAHRPPLVPRTRKAHELVLHAEGTGDAAVRNRLVDRLFRAHLEEGADLGRIDVLVALATEEGLDRSETRAALDVDRWRDGVEAARRRAMEDGVRGVPTLSRGTATLEGIHDDDTLRAFTGVDRTP